VLRPIVAFYGLIIAGVLLAFWAALKLTIRVRRLNFPADFDTHPTIECSWHEALWPYFVAAMPYRKPYAWLNHPAPYMKGVHYFLRCMGVRRLVLGSSGHGGRRALDQLIPILASGASTFLNPDGPKGPAHQVKDGVLDLSQRTGLPVFAVRVRCSRAMRLPTWDRKLVPLPFSTVELDYAAPLRVTGENREAARGAIGRHLDGVSEGAERSSK
jgi:lysophospholipid acyltransferase (LPLAT)-like uncharacterized protein